MLSGEAGQRVERFLAKWLGSGGNERANDQTFFGDFCDALGVDKPPPKGSVPGDPYCFEKDIKFFVSGDRAETTRFADFYKEGCFLIEAKQGSETSSKGHGKRGSKRYLDAMQQAFNQARSYAYSHSLPSRPPFLITCDIGSHFEIWEGFSGDYGSYGARQRVNLADLRDPGVFDRVVKIFTDPQALNPEKYRAKVTREVAAELAKLSRWLENNRPDPLTLASVRTGGGSTFPSPNLGEGSGERADRAFSQPLAPSPDAGEGDFPQPLTPSPKLGEGGPETNRVFPHSLASASNGEEGGPEGGERKGAGTAAEAMRWEIPRSVKQKMTEVARQFRKEPTPSEEILWQALRRRKLDGRKFRRQQPIGPFVVDFFCASERLVVEVDGGIHEAQQAYDRERQQLLESLGLRFVRVAAEQVEADLPRALEAIQRAFAPLPSPKLGEGSGERADRVFPQPLAPSPDDGEGDFPQPLAPSPSLGEGGPEGIGSGANLSFPQPLAPSPNGGEGGPEGIGSGASYAQEVAQFLMRCIFTMFAEDVKLLKGEVFTKALHDRWIPHPETFKPEIEQLWRTMNTGGSFGFERVLQFNGSFFENATAIALPKEQLEVLYEAAKKDWSEVEPAIFGTLLERALDKKERSRLGAHYTPRSYVERLVRPVVMEPLRQEWDEVELELKRLLEPAVGTEEPTVSQRRKAEQEIRAFLDKLRRIRILDPACGTGNFLYVSLDLLKGLELEVQTRLVDVAGQVQLNVLEQINPSQFLGIEINPRAAAIAELVIWIGYLQWYFKRYGNAEPPEPVLQAFGNIECRDAVLAYDGTEPDVDPKTGRVRTRWGGRTVKHPVTGQDVPDPTDQVVIYRYLNPRPAEWPEADYVVSNPPFIGTKRMKDFLGEGYTKTIRSTIKAVPESSDFVVYWWNHAANAVRDNQLLRFGFIATNSLSQAFNRRVIEEHLSSKKPLSIDFAIPDHPWVDSSDGADVRISMTVASVGKHSGRLLNVISEKFIGDGCFEVTFKKFFGEIYADLTVGLAISQVKALKANSNVSGMGSALHGSGFILSPEKAAELRRQGASVIRPYLGGKDLLHVRRERYVIDFSGLSESEAQEINPSAFQHVLDYVKPERDQNRRESIRKFWWRFGWERPVLRRALKEIKRYIATTETAKHRTFQFVDCDFVPDHMIVTLALQDAFDLGILSSQIHVIWAVKVGGRLGVGNDPRYNKTRCFDPFPFPDPTPEQKQKIRELGDRLDAHRKRVQAAHPDITITGMYNLLEKLRAGEPFTDADREYNNRALVSTLKQIHDELDIAVLEAYGWDDLIPLLSPSPRPGEGLGERVNSPSSSPRLGEGLGERVNSPSFPHPPAPSPIGGEGGPEVSFGERATPSFPSPQLGEGPRERAILVPSPLGGEGGPEVGFDEIILERLVALNAERAEEERNGLIRWLRPEYQAPDQAPAVQTALEGLGIAEETVVEPVEQRKWPTQPREQLAAIRDLLRTTPGDWTIAQIAAQFTGKNTKKKLEAIAENLERLEWFGLVIAEPRDGLSYWHCVE